MKQHLCTLNNMKDNYAILKENIDSFYTEPFQLIIETKHICNVSWTMVVDFSFFLKQLKQKDPQHLKYTTIHVYSETIYNILYNLFTYLSRPIAPVKVLFFNEEDELKNIKTYYP